jgi:GNAT superfamily N-acetyltransferase
MSDPLQAPALHARQAAAEHVPRLIDVLAAAFHDDPVLGWLMPDEGTRAARLRRFFAVELRAVGLARGTVWCDDELTGAVITTPPGRWRLPLAVQVRHGPAFARAFGARLPHATILLARMEHRHLREPHHYLAYIGVVPEAQGRGLGASLMAPTLARCDAEGLPAYLEASSPRNAALYERLGFRALGELTLGSSPPLVLMRRAPRS